MKKETMLFGVIGLVIGALIMMALATNAVNSQDTKIMKMMGMGVANMRSQNQGMGMDSSMEQMMGSMKDKSGYNFDKAFIDAMIVHHQGAIKMAEQAEHRAEHQEIKDLSKNIITSQTAEIEQMKQWKKNWKME